MSPRKAHAYRLLSLKKRAWLTIGAVVVSGAGAVTVAMANASGAGPGAHARPASTVTRSLTAQGAGKAEAGATVSHTFQLVSLSWDDKKGSRLDGSAQVRTRDAATGKWSDWTTLGKAETAQDVSAPRGKPLRALTDLWLPAPADAAQARLVAKDGTQLPKGAKLGLIDPGTAPAKQNGGTSLAAAPVGYALDATDSASPADASSPTDSSSPTAPSSPPDTAAPTGTPAQTPTPTASPSVSAPSSSSPSTGPSPSPSATWPSDCDLSNTAHGAAPSSPVAAPQIITSPVGCRREAC